MVHISNFLIAVQFLTRLPIPARLQTEWTMADLRDSVHMFPLVGILVGLGASLVYAAAVFCNLPPVIAAILAVATQILMTGALHEDGLADVCDGFGGGRTREQKLEIMRDSRLGTYGAIGLILGLALRVGAIAHLETVTVGLVAAAVLSRATMPFAMLFLPQARPEGLAASAGRPRPGRVYLGAVIGVVMAFLGLPAVAAGGAVIAGIVVAGLFLSMSRRQIGGISGDVLGSLQQIVEVACLITVLALASPTFS